MIRAGVAGWPIAHSLSPLIHSTWIAAAGLDARYEAFGPEDEAAFKSLIIVGRDGGLAGLNVTAPYKGLALSLADEATSAAEACGSANILVFRDGRVLADSTDGLGLMQALAEQVPNFDVAGRPVVILGAGGATRAAAVALKSAGAEVGLLNRTRSKAEMLADALAVSVVGPETLENAALIVNALSVQPDLDVAQFADNAVLMDMTYRPLVTPFLAAGRARGLRIVDGLAMLIGQARPSFEAICGVPVPPVDIRRVVLDALGETA